MANRKDKFILYLNLIYLAGDAISRINDKSKYSYIHKLKYTSFLSFSFRLCNPILLLLPWPSLLGGIHFEIPYHLQTEFWWLLQLILPIPSKTGTMEANFAKKEEEHELDTGSSI